GLALDFFLARFKQDLQATGVNWIDRLDSARHFVITETVCTRLRLLLAPLLLRRRWRVIVFDPFHKLFGLGLLVFEGPPDKPRSQGYVDFRHFQSRDVSRRRMPVV